MIREAQPIKHCPTWSLSSSEEGVGDEGERDVVLNNCDGCYHLKEAAGT